MKNEFIFPLRVYVDDTDYGGIVHHSKYLVFMERARIEWLAHAGLTYRALVDRQLHFIVRGIEINYLKPTKLDELIEVFSSVEHIGKTSLHFKQIVRSQKNPDIIYASAVVKLVCINNDFKPCAVPNDIVEKLT